MNIKIAAFILCYNEKEILPHTIKHYKEFCKDIFILNNGSTDNTPDIARHFGCSVIDYKSEGINELQYLEIKQNCYKPYSNLYDYVIVCDADEFLYHKNIIKYLQDNKNVEIFKCTGYEMVYDNFDYSKDSHRNIIFGSRSASHDKSIIFNPNVQIRYSIGCHTVENVTFESKIELRHLKYINIDYVLKRYKEFSIRMSNINKINNWGFHYNWEKQKILNYFQSLVQNKIILEW